MRRLLPKDGVEVAMMGGALLVIGLTLFAIWRFGAA